MSGRFCGENYGSPLRNEESGGGAGPATAQFPPFGIGRGTPFFSLTHCTKRKTRFGNDRKCNDHKSPTRPTVAHAGPKRNYASNESRATLVREATNLLTERPYAGTGIDEIIRLAGLSKGTFYYFFGAKREFGEAV
ncbi:TetR/AcrR family transcriptional regulator [Telluria mixta]